MTLSLAIRHRLLEIIIAEYSVQEKGLLPREIDDLCKVLFHNVMKDFCPSQSETKKILERLRRSKSEASNIDCKETLNLKEKGDCATFIRHIASIANTGQKGYLIIGVEDKTWFSKGIDPNSPLLMVDSTQQQMNQILANKLDPPVNVDYRVYDIDGVAIGVVGLEGNKPPYVVSIEELRYGGPKNKGKESYIYKGVIYIRRGTDSVPLVRQIELLELLNGKRDYIEVAMSLVFIGVLVGVGIGSSQIRFSDPYIAALFGGTWGILIGWMLNKQLADAFGKFPKGVFGRIIKSAGGIFWGGTMGTFLSYTITHNILSGKTKVLDPISMGLIIVPIFAVVITLTVMAYAYFANDIINHFRKN